MKALGLLVGLFLFLNVAEAETLKYAICRNGKIVRTIRVIKAFDIDRACETVYSKQGKDKTVGWGVNPGSCIDFYDRIKNNLESNSWSCKEVGDFTLDSAEESAE